MEVQKRAFGRGQKIITLDIYHYHNSKRKTIIKSRSQLTMSFLTEYLEERGFKYFNLESHI